MGLFDLAGFLWTRDCGGAGLVRDKYSELLRQDQLAVACEAQTVFISVMQQDRFAPAAHQIAHRDPLDGRSGRHRPFDGLARHAVPSLANSYQS